NPIVYYNTLSNLFAPGVTLANRPATVEALETNYTTPSSINWSVGVRREVGWGTAVDGTYLGYNAVHMEVLYDLHGVADRPAVYAPPPGDARPQAARAPAADGGGAAGEFPPPVWRLQELPPAGRLREGPLSPAAGAGEPPLHPRGAIRRGVHGPARS